MSHTIEVQRTFRPEIDAALCTIVGGTVGGMAITTSKPWVCTMMSDFLSRLLLTALCGVSHTASAEYFPIHLIRRDSRSRYDGKLTGTLCYRFPPALPPNYAKYWQCYYSPADLALVRLGRALRLRLLLVLRLRLLGLHVRLEGLHGLGRLGVGLSVVRRWPSGLSRSAKQCHAMSFQSRFAWQDRARKSCPPLVMACHVPTFVEILSLS